MLCYFSEQWLNGFRNQTNAANTILLMELTVIALATIFEIHCRQRV